MKTSKILAAWVMSVAFLASAAPITFDLTGRVTDDAISGCGAVVNCGIVTISYTFDSDAPDQNPDPVAGLFAVTSLSFSIDGILFFSSTDSLINVANFGSVDQYGVLAFGSAVGFSDATLSLLLSDASHTAFNSDALPTDPSALNPLFPGSFQLNASDDAFQLLGTLETASSTTVPEPSSAVFLVVGMATILSSRRLLRQRQ